MSRVLGAVLAGGASSRFGSDKAAALLDGRPLLDHARAALAPLCDEVIAVGRPGGPGDRPASGLGPLGGIAGALDHAGRHGFDGVLTIACDMPGVPLALLRALLERRPSFCADAPVLGHWPAALAPLLIKHLRGDTPRSVRRWALAIGAHSVAAPAPLANVNTPADLPRCPSP